MFGVIVKAVITVIAQTVARLGVQDLWEKCFPKAKAKRLASEVSDKQELENLKEELERLESELDKRD